MSKLYSAYDLPIDIPTGDFEESLTQQHFAEEVNINNILERYINTGTLMSNSQSPLFIDCSTIPQSFAEMQNFMIDAQDSFYHLPLNVRERFDNNIARLLDFVANPANREEAINLGLVAPPDPVVPPEVPPEG